MPYLGPVIICVVALIILIILIKNIRVVQQARAFVIERLGAYSTEELVIARDTLEIVSAL